MNYDYLDQAITGYNKGKSKDQQHPMTEQTLALMWLRVPDMPTFEKVAEQISSSPEYTSPAVKMRNGLVGHRVVPRCLQGSAVRHALAAGAGHPGDACRW